MYVADRLNACVRRIDVLTGDVTQIGILYVLLSTLNRITLRKSIRFTYF